MENSMSAYRYLSGWVRGRRIFEMKTYLEHDASFYCRYVYRRSSGEMIIHEEVDDDKLVYTPAICE
jgi:hypothetical protein